MSAHAAVALPALQPAPSCMALLTDLLTCACLPACLLNHLPSHMPACSYEAWVIYNFMSLCLAYVGGPGAVEVKMHGFVLLPSCAAGTCCMPPLPVNGRFVRYTKQMALQFVLVKPVLAALTLILYSTGHYSEGNWAPNNGCAGLCYAGQLRYSRGWGAPLLWCCWRVGRLARRRRHF